MRQLCLLYQRSNETDAPESIEDLHLELANALGLDYHNISLFFQDYEEFQNRSEDIPSEKRKSKEAADSNSGKKSRRHNSSPDLVSEIQKLLDLHKRRRSQLIEDEVDPGTIERKLPQRKRSPQSKKLTGKRHASMMNISTNYLSSQEASVLRKESRQRERNSLRENFPEPFESGFRAEDLIMDSSITELSKSSKHTELNYARPSPVQLSDSQA